MRALLTHFPAGADPFQAQPADHVGLNFAYGAGRVRSGTTVTDVAAGTVTLTDDANNYVEVVPSTGAVSANTSGFTAGRIPLYIVGAASGVITTTTDKRTMMDGTSETAVTDHIGDASGAHAASAVSFTPAGSVAATDVQAAIVEVSGDADGAQSTADTHIADTDDAHDAAAVSFDPSGLVVITGITEVQAALAAVDAALDDRLTEAESSAAYQPTTGVTSGKHYKPAMATLSTTTPSEAIMQCIPLFIPKAATFDRIFAEVTGAGTAGAVVRLGIYADDGSGSPGALIVDGGTIDGTSATIQSVTISQALSAGWVWLASAVQGAAGTRPTMRSTGTSQVTLEPVGDPNMDFLANHGYFRASITGALPTPFTPTAGAGNLIVMGLRAA